ncbi:MAG: hypothetical protein LBI92_11850 [Azoarcus sp.]|jgi:hypothetical protein|nr:hypothetical protein [Azoarcus sp.]
MNYAILIDGGFAKRKIGNAKHPATSVEFKSLIDKITALPNLREHRLHRVYYYDSTLLTSHEQKPLGGDPVDFGTNPVVERSTRMFGELAKLPFMARYASVSCLSMDGGCRRNALRRKTAKG